MSDALDGIVAALNGQSALPPLDRWNPPLSGVIDIVIRRNGEWLHEGTPIRRDSLVKLFASILRREADGEYYLVTPVEKWRIAVEEHPLLIVDVDRLRSDSGIDQLLVTSNVGRRYLLGAQYPLALRDEEVPIVQLDHGVEARFDRPAYYRLVEEGIEEGGALVVYSEGSRFVVGTL